MKGTSFVRAQPLLARSTLTATSTNNVTRLTRAEVPNPRSRSNPRRVNGRDVPCLERVANLPSLLAAQLSCAAYQV